MQEKIEHVQGRGKCRDIVFLNAYGCVGTIIGELLPLTVFSLLIELTYTVVQFIVNMVVGE